MNLRKDHYRSVPGYGGLPAEDTLTAAAGGAQAPPAQRPLNSGSWGENLGREEARAALSVVLTAALRRTGLPCASARAGDGGQLRGTVRRAAAALRRFFSSLFFSPRFQLSSAPASPPRATAPAGGRLRSEPLAQARPDGADGPPHGYRRTRLAPPERLGGVFKVLAAGNGDRGAPGGFAPINLIQVCPRTSTRNKNQRVQLLAVDHSARASMKNAASCEK